MKFKKKSIQVEATQWFKNGDHPFDESIGELFPTLTDGFFTEGKVVKKYRGFGSFEDDVKGSCNHCDHHYNKHGWIDTWEGGHIVCPGDWIITGIKGEFYPCKNEVFKETYERVNE